MNGRDFFKTIAVKCGKTDEMEAVLNNPALATIEIDDVLANDINSALLTIEGAKNNQTIKNHFSASALNGMDAEILNSVDVLGFDDAFKTELSGIKNTYQKYRKLNSKITETVEALKAATQKDDTKEIEKRTAQINKLQSELSNYKESYVPKSEVETINKRHESELTDFIVRNTLFTKKYSTGSDADVNVEFANVILNKALAAKGIVLAKDGNSLKLKQAADPALDYYDDQQKAVAFGDFVDKALADAKILAVSDPKKTTPVTPVQSFPVNQTPVHDNSAVTAQLVNNLRD
jgi:hypothetical protein